MMILAFPCDCQSIMFSLDSLYLKVAHMDIELPTTELVLGHGPSKFLSAEKVAKMQREQCAGWVVG